MSTRAHRVGLDLIARPKQVEAALWRRLRFEQEARCREMLFNTYQALARAIAASEFRRRPAYGLERADFQQLACGGLLEAIDRFDPLRGAPFDAFAKHRIRGAIADGLARSSEAGAQYSHRRRAEVERLRSLSAEIDSSDSIAALSDVAAALAIGLVAEGAKLIDETPGGEDRGLDAYEGVSWRDTQLSVLREIDRLPDAERTVLQQHYVNSVPFVQIAQLLGVSKGRVSQLHRSAMMRVRERLRYSD